jgi:CBS domain-containing protein
MRTLTVGEMMTTKVKAVREEDSMDLADWGMAVGEIRHVPVVDEDRRVIGIVSDRDVLRGLAQRHGYPIRVSEIMTRNVHTVTAATPAVEAAEEMLRSRFHAMVVVDDDNALVGLVTSTDFVELAHRALAGFDVSQPHTRS